MASATVRLEVEVEVECSNKDAKAIEAGDDFSQTLQDKVSKLEDALLELPGTFKWVLSVDVSSDVSEANPDD